ncbi:Membrane-bound lytic murein transglycosylase D [Pseudomonas carbonaria]|uniref:Membrane-bound lytic murein transglycosylase D n=1 Tax=Zestomonas carbonaria TaxID=2762745 RepID=A0A7U7IBD0_9GAMM|nr:Membrane-bound lytic murein transglycosylase D [Pseudomonas carbonaria]
MRAARVLLAAFALVLAGCQNMGSQVAPPSQDSVRAVAPERQPEWLEAAEPEPPQDIWDRMRAGFKLQDEIDTNPRIERQRLWFASKPSYLETVSGRGSLYVHFVVESLEQRNMPLELALLPVIESAYDPFAYSRSHAAGLWQFIPTTGRYYNLQQTNWYDGRRDITASTSAALDYLTRLHEMFNGDWLLALAAYNAGEGTVSRAIERNQKLGLPTDYWNLPLPQETQDYVPKLLALSQLVNAPEAYGINLHPIANEPYFEVVEIKQRMDLTRLAALANVDADELYQLNPAFKKRITYGGPQHLLVPVDKAELLTANLSTLKPQDLKVDWQEYKVRSGDSLHAIAKRHQVTVAELKEINHLSGNHLRAGQTLTLPLRAGERVQQPATQVASRASTSKSRTYRIKPGDNLWQIAKAHNVTVAELKRLNKLSSYGLKVGQVLSLPAGSTSLAANQAGQRQNVTYYKVRKGDSMSQIAKRFNVEMKRLQDWNPHSSTFLKPGQTLTLYLTNR